MATTTTDSCWQTHDKPCPSQRTNAGARVAVARLCRWPPSLKPCSLLNLETSLPEDLDYCIVCLAFRVDGFEAASRIPKGGIDSGNRSHSIRLWHQRMSFSMRVLLSSRLCVPSARQSALRACGMRQQAASIHRASDVKWRDRQNCCLSSRSDGGAWVDFIFS